MNHPFVTPETGAEELPPALTKQGWQIRRSFPQRILLFHRIDTDR